MSDLIEAHLARLRAQGRSPHTIDDRQKLLRRLDRELPHGLEGASDEELELFLGQAGWAAETRSTYFSHIVGFYRWATAGRKPHLDYDPSADIDRPQVTKGVPRPLSDLEVTHALEHLDGHRLDAVILALGAGMRVGEVARAGAEHVDQDGVRIFGKGGKTRVVPTCPEVRALVNAAPTGLLVPHLRGGPWVPDQLSHDIARGLDAIGLHGVTLHRFRHTFATRLVRAGANIVAVQRLMGHANLATTQVYADVYGSDLVEAMARLPAFVVRGGSGRRGPERTTPTPHASDQVSAA
jgi:integrase/recombinase XerC